MDRWIAGMPDGYRAKLEELRDKSLRLADKIDENLVKSPGVTSSALAGQIVMDAAALHDSFVQLEKHSSGDAEFEQRETAVWRFVPALVVTLRTICSGPWSQSMVYDLREVTRSALESDLKKLLSGGFSVTSKLCRLFSESVTVSLSGDQEIPEALNGRSMADQINLRGLLDAAGLWRSLQV